MTRMKESTKEDSARSENGLNVDSIFAFLMDTDNNKELKDVKYQSSKSLRMKMASILKASGDLDTLSEVS